MVKTSLNKQGHAALTLKENAIIREIITDCSVSIGFPVSKFANNPSIMLPPIFDAKALWDTGATNSAITKRLIDKLGILPFTNVQVCHADGITKKSVYKINIILPNKTMWELINVTEVSGISGNFDLLLGMDIITQGDFAITNQNNKTIVSFRSPSSCYIDFNDGETIISHPAKEGAIKPQNII